MRGTDKENKEALIQALMVAAKDKDLLNDFLEDLLTPKERRALPKRWEIIRRLHKGEKQWSVAGDLQIGIGTITRGARELKKPNGGFTRVLQILKK